MRLIFGIVNTEQQAIDPADMDQISTFVERNLGYRTKVQYSENAVFGIAAPLSEKTENIQVFESNDRNGLFTVEARLDNRSELADKLKLNSSEKLKLTDHELVHLCYRKWGKTTPEKLYGDWQYAAWNVQEQELILARDHLGLTSLFYAHKPPFVAFSSYLPALMALSWVKPELNSESLVRFLGNNPGSDWARTWFKGVKSIPHARFVKFSTVGESTHSYWDLRNIQKRNTSLSQDQVHEEFIFHFNQAIKSRLRETASVGTTLSAGLDSSSVTALTAQQLAFEDRSITSYTSVPYYASPKWILANEWPIAHKVAQEFPNIHHKSLSSEGISPIAAIRNAVDLGLEPIPGPGALYWLFDLINTSNKDGLDILLTGAVGNGSISWSGGANRIYESAFKGKFASALSGVSGYARQEKILWPKAVYRKLIRPMTNDFSLRFGRNNHGRPKVVQEFSYLKEDFFEASNGFLAQEVGSDNRLIMPEEERLAILELGALGHSRLWCVSNLQSGVKMVDPTADIQLIEFCFSIPEPFYANKAGERMLIRESMKGVLPDSVRLNTLKGKQSADLYARVKQVENELMSEFEELRGDSFVSSVIDFEAMERAWRNIHSNSGYKQEWIITHKILRVLMVARFLSTHTVY